MQFIKNPQRSEWPELLQRPVLDTRSLEATVSDIINDVKTSGDEAVRRLTLQFDKVAVSRLAVSMDEINEAEAAIPGELRAAMRQAYNNISTFHSKQVTIPEWIETMPGVMCSRRNVAIEKVGLYIPGGS